MVTMRKGALIACLLGSFSLPARAELLQVDLTIYGMD
jgi:hypothetical protein